MRSQRQQLKNTPLLPRRHAIQCCASISSTSRANIWPNAGTEACIDAWRVSAAGRSNLLRASGHLFKCSSCQPQPDFKVEGQPSGVPAHARLWLIQCFRCLQGPHWCSTYGGRDSSSSWGAVPPSWRAPSRHGHDPQGSPQVSCLQQLHLCCAARCLVMQQLTVGRLLFLDVCMLQPDRACCLH